MNNNTKLPRKIDWVNSAFLIILPIIGLGGTGWLVAHDAIQWKTVVLAFVWAIFTGIAITGGYHRLFSHLTYQAKWPYRLFMLCFGAAAFENSALSWSSDHRAHHKFVDTEKDPYNIRQGFWHAHMGWVMMESGLTHRFDNVADLKDDKLVMFQHRHYVSLGVLFGFLVPTVLAAGWGDALGGFFLAGFLRTVINHHFTFSINSFAHLFGTQPYSDDDSSRDSWALAFVTYGEGYHNYHHKFPTDYRNGIHFFHWDPTKWVIRGLERFGLTSNLRRVPAEVILRARLKMDEKLLLSKITRADARQNVPEEAVSAARGRLEEAYLHFQMLRKEYSRIKTERLESLSAAMAHKAEELRADLVHARIRLHEAKSQWGTLCNRFGVRPVRLSVA